MKGKYFLLSSFIFKWTWSMALTATSRHQTIEIYKKCSYYVYSIFSFLLFQFAWMELNSLSFCSIGTSPQMTRVSHIAKWQYCSYIFVFPGVAVVDAVQYSLWGRRFGPCSRQKFFSAKFDSKGVVFVYFLQLIHTLHNAIVWPRT